MASIIQVYPFRGREADPGRNPLLTEGVSLIFRKHTDIYLTRKPSRVLLEGHGLDKSSLFILVPINTPSVTGVFTIFILANKSGNFRS